MDRDLRRVARYFETQQIAFERLSRKASRRPSGHALHQLRVTTRKIRTALWLLENTSPRLTFDDLQRDLRKLGPLGEARELDVAIRDAPVYRLDPSPLKHKRKKKRKLIRKKLTSHQRKQVISELKSARKTLCRQTALGFAPAFKALREELHPWISGRSPTDRDLHRLRVSVKRARYAFEATGKPVSRLEALQDVLGKYHDLAVLKQLMGKHAPIEREQAALRLKLRHIAPPALRAALGRLEAA